jgi:hypothetical protein
MNSRLLFQVQRSDHYAVPGASWCSCGERADQCFVLSVLLPAHEITVSALYNRLFQESDKKGQGNA